MACSSVLALLYAVSLYLICKDIKLPFVVNIIILLILSNVAAVVVVYTNIEITKDPWPTYIYWIVFLQAFMSLVRDGCFNIGHWMFAYQYYNSAICMQYIFKQIHMPPKRERNLRWLNQSLSLANLAVPAVYTAILGYGNLRVVQTVGVVAPISKDGDLFWPYMASRYSVGTLQLVSGVFLLVAVFMISRFLVQQGLRNQVNYKQMILHSVSFSLYNLSIIGFYVAYYAFESTPKDSPQEKTVIRDGLIAWTVTTYTNFVA